MSYYRSQSVENPLRESFDVYLNDKYAASDLIQTLTVADLRGVLQMTRDIAPHAVAKVLAIFWPYCATLADEVEAAIQESEPLF